jgi:hypothetical protein
MHIIRTKKRGENERKKKEGARLFENNCLEQVHASLLLTAHILF